MNESLQSICESFIRNRDIIRNAFKWEHNAIYPICANIFVTNGCTVTPDRLKECREVIRRNTGIFSNFRGNIRAVLASTLAVSEDPERRMQQAVENYGILKKSFWATEYLALTAFLLPDISDADLVREKAVRGKVLYKRMVKEHPFLTGSGDSVFAVLLAFSEKTDDLLISDMEDAYTDLKERFPIGDELQTVSHILTVADGMPREKSRRLIELYDALREAGLKFSKYHGLTALAALSLTDADIPGLVDEIREVDAFLKAQKGYGIGLIGLGPGDRMMNAAMLVSDQYRSRADMNAAAMTSTLAAIIAQEMAMIAVATSTSMMAASSSRSN